MSVDDFEKQLQRQPLRRVPGEWREEILQQATASTRNSERGTRKGSWFLTLLWPNPKAWAGLGAAWVVILALHFSSHQDAPQISEKRTPPSVEMIAGLKDQQKILAELIGPTAMNDSEPPRKSLPRPHSERRGITAMA